MHHSEAGGTQGGSAKYLNDVRVITTACRHMTLMHV